MSCCAAADKYRGLENQEGSFLHKSGNCPLNAVENGERTVTVVAYLLFTGNIF